MTPTTHNRRLIEDWLPVNEISIEAVREGGALAGHPPVNQLHVWWARRPLVASRSAIAASLLNSDADHDTFIDAIGTTKTVVAERRKMDEIKATGQWSDITFSNKRAFTHNLTDDERAWFHDNLAVQDPVVLDVTAGGGSIPFEAGRLGLRSHANELNPVANIILHATCQWPQRHGNALLDEYERVSKRFLKRVKKLMKGVYPDVPPFEDENSESKNFETARAHRDAQTSLWARAVCCPSCSREIPLSPTWRLSPSPKNDGIRLLPDETAGTCGFQLVNKASEHSPATVKGGVAVCPYPTCGNSTPKGYLAAEAQAGRMGHRLYCVIYRDQRYTLTKSGRPSKRPKTTRTFAEPRPEDADMDAIEARLAQLRPRWEAEDILPNEAIPEIGDKTVTPHQYGMPTWRDMFNPRQQLAHGYCVQAFRELVDEDEAAGKEPVDEDKAAGKEPVDEDEAAGKLTDIRRAAWCYVGLALDKVVNRNCFRSIWDPGTNKVAHTFSTHDFGMKWSYAEMTVTIMGLGLEWALEEMRGCIDKLSSMAGHPKPEPSDSSPAATLISDDVRPAVDDHVAPASKVTLGLAQDLDIQSGSVDAIVFDPPYHNNVNYAELSDFFYVWLKRTVGRVYPDLCQPYLSDKVNEAIASPARFRDRAVSSDKSARDLATDDYHAKMREIFVECRRVIKDDGIMTVMFTHKSAGAWDALITALIESGFRITRTWPVKTESDSSLHIRGQAAVRTTILLVCRPMERNPAPFAWHRVQRLIEDAVRRDIRRLQSYGLKPIDLYLAAFGPALEVISAHWGTEREVANPLRPGADEFKVTPSDAMEVARLEVSRHRAEWLSELFTRVTDPLTRFYVLATDVNTGDTMDYDEAALLARSAGLNIDKDARGVVSKRSGKVTLKAAVDRMAEDVIGPGRAAVTPLDQVHVAIAMTDRQGSESAENWLKMHGIDPHGDQFKGTLEALHGAMKLGHPDLQAARNLYQKLYGVEPPRQMPLLGLQGE